MGPTRVRAITHLASPRALSLRTRAEPWYIQDLRSMGDQLVLKISQKVFELYGLETFAA